MKIANNGEKANRKEESLGLRLAAILFGLLIVILSLSFAELMARKIYPDRVETVTNEPEGVNHIMDHPVLNHIWLPNSSWEHRTNLSRGVPLYTLFFNSQSWIESYDVQPAKPENTFRIFYVGDSFMEGIGGLDQSVPSLIEKWLEDDFRKQGYDIEVINTGTSSYSPMIYYLLLKHYISSYSPDLVVVNVDMTDVFDDFFYRATAVYDPEGELVAVPPGHPLKGQYRRTRAGLEKIPLRERIYAFLTSHSRLAGLTMKGVRAIKRRVRWQMVKVDPEKAEDIKRNFREKSKKKRLYMGLFDWCLKGWSGDTEKNVALSMERLRSMVRLAKSENVKIAVTAIPHLRHFLPEADVRQYSHRPFEEVRKVSEEEGVPYLDTYGGFLSKMGTTKPEDYYIPDDMHLNEMGQFLWARVQLDFLMDPNNHLLPEPILLGPEDTMPDGDELDLHWRGFL